MVATGTKSTTALAQLTQITALTKTTCNLSTYPYFLFTKRCNNAIRIALQIAKAKGYTSVCIPESGGWITYAQFAKKLKMQVIFIPTNNEQIAYETLENQPNCVYLFHTLAGYHTKLDSQKIRTIADATKSLYIEDICGVVGRQTPRGHVCVCSFGNAKPLSIGEGGFIASEIVIPLTEKTYELTPEFIQKLTTKLTHLSETYAFFNVKKNEILGILLKNEIPAQDIICNAESLVIIATFKTETQQKNILKLCEKLNVPYTLCPRYIRHNKPAISIEIKRLMPPTM